MAEAERPLFRIRKLPPEEPPAGPRRPAATEPPRAVYGEPGREGEAEGGPEAASGGTGRPPGEAPGTGSQGGTAAGAASRSRAAPGRGSPSGPAASEASTSSASASSASATGAAADRAARESAGSGQAALAQELSGPGAAAGEIPAAVSSAGASTAATGGLFTSPHGLLSFLAAVAGARLTDQATCRRAPPEASSEGEWWADVEVPWDLAASYVRTAGGLAFEAMGERWIEVPILDLAGLGTASRGTTSFGTSPRVSGEARPTLPPPGPVGASSATTPDAGATRPGAPGLAAGRRAPLLAVSGWPQVGIADLLAGLRLPPAPLRAWPAVEVVVPGALGRWVLRRAAALGLAVTLRTARWRPLSGEGEASGVLLIRIEPREAGGGRRRGGLGTVPASLVEALTRLPLAVVARSVGPEGGRLLVDLRSRPPAAAALLAAMVPEGERWVLSGGDLGHGRLELAGEEIDGAELLSAPAPPSAELPAASEARLPQPLAVRLVAGPGRRGPADAVLLDDQELAWLQSYLATRPAGERAFLLPGPGRHLLTAPGGLGGDLPFGLPLTRIGPGGLYLEAGQEFFPPLPEGARREVYGLGDGSAVVVAAEGAYRFALERLIPAWTLWVGGKVEVGEGLSGAAQDLVGRLAALLARPELPRPALPRVARERPARDRSRLLREAQEAELHGNLVQAAERLEEAGDLAGAGRLYERAALAGLGEAVVRSAGGRGERGPSDGQMVGGGRDGRATLDEP